MLRRRDDVPIRSWPLFRAWQVMLILYRVLRMRLKANARAKAPSRLLEQLQRIHQQTVFTADGQVLHGLTEMTPAQKSLFTVLQLPIPTPAEISQPVLWTALLTLGPSKSTIYVL